MGLEASPTLPPVPGVDLDSHRDTLIERFGRPVIREQLRRGGNIHRSLAIVARRVRYAEGIDEKGPGYDLDDTESAEPTRPARAYPEDLSAVIDNERTFGDLAGSERFRTANLDAWMPLHEQSAASTVPELTP